MPVQDKNPKTDSKVEVKPEATTESKDKEESTKTEEEKTVQLSDNAQVNQDQIGDQAKETGPVKADESNPEKKPAVVTTGVDTEVITEERSNLKWIVIIVVLVLLIIALGGGAFYYLTQYKLTPSSEILSPEAEITAPITTPAVTEEDELTKELQQVSKSDEIDVLVDELENTDLNSLDKEVKDIDNELTE